MELLSKARSGRLRVRRSSTRNTSSVMVLRNVAQAHSTQDISNVMALLNTSTRPPSWQKLSSARLHLSSMKLRPPRKRKFSVSSMSPPREFRASFGTSQIIPSSARNLGVQTSVPSDRQRPLKSLLFQKRNHRGE